MSGPKRRFGAVFFDGGFSSDFVFPAIGIDVGAEELRDEPSLVAVEIANVGSVLRGVLFECFDG